MGNDLKYGLILGAVVLLIFAGYYAIRTHGPKPRPVPQEVASRPAPSRPNIFEQPATQPAPAADTAVIEFGQPAETPGQPAAAAPAPAAPLGAPARVGISAPLTGTATAPLTSVGPAPTPGTTQPGAAERPEPTLLPSLVQPRSEPTPTAATYKIAQGDTLQGISTKFYSTTTKWRRIYEANKDKISDPDRLSVGTEITIPERERAESPGAARAGESRQEGPSGITGGAGGKTYTVVKGDTLTSIAKDRYGDGNEWRKIYNANRDKLPNENDLKVGMTLTIP